MNTTFAERVPLVVNTSQAGDRRPVAAIPTKTPGLYVHWQSTRRCYVVAAECGLFIATGWNRPQGALRMAADLAGITDWAEATKETVLDLPYRSIIEIGETAHRHGGVFHTSFPCHLTAEIEDLRGVRNNLIEENEELHARIGELTELLKQAGIEAATAIGGAQNA